MKKFPIGLLLVMAMFLYGCPYESPYNLDETANQRINDNLLGKWTTTVEAKPGRENSSLDTILLTFSKRSDQEYNITISGQIDKLKPFHIVKNDSISGTAFISNLAGKQFINTFIHGRVYIAQLVLENNILSLLTLPEYFTSKFIKSSGELRTAVAFYYKVQSRPAYDLQFSLHDLQKVH